MLQRRATGGCCLWLADMAAAVTADACACTRLPRRWAHASDVLEHPLGVYAFKSPRGAERYHALFAKSRDSQVLLGCYETQTEAAEAWDAAARAHGIHIANRPAAGEREAKQYLMQCLGRARRAGFPYPPTDAGWREDELGRFLTVDPLGAWHSAEGATSTGLALMLRQEDHDTAPGNQLCFSFHPHSFGVRKSLAAVQADGAQRPRKPRPSSLDTYASPLYLAKCVRSAVEYRGDVAVSPMTLAGELRFLQGSWICNFQPAVAAAIYARYGGRGGVVYDSSAGWGGRLLGARLAGATKYIACEPSTATFAGLRALSALAAGPMAVELHCVGSESFIVPEVVDVAFTSPPYFSLELYADEPTQSHIKFRTFEAWRLGFLQACAHFHGSAETRTCTSTHVRRHTHSTRLHARTRTHVCCMHAYARADMRVARMHARA